MDLYAWIGEDEHGSGKVGIKIGHTQAGYIPLVSTDYDRSKLERLAVHLQQQADTYGKTIRLARFTYVEDVMTLPPRGN